MRQIIAVLIFCLAGAVQAHPELGPQVDAVCGKQKPPSRPFEQGGCLLCHTGTNLSQPVQPQWAWTNERKFDRFCVLAREPILAETAQEMSESPAPGRTESRPPEPQPALALEVEFSGWVAEAGELRVRGKRAAPGTVVSIFDAAAAGRVLGSTVADAQGRWGFDESGLEKPPCQLRIENGDRRVVHTLDAPGCPRAQAAQAVPRDKAYFMMAGTVLTVPAPGVLADGGAPEGVQVQLVTPPRQGSVTLSATGAFRYVPVPGFIGRDQFTYRIAGLSAGPAASVSIQVMPGPQGGPLIAKILDLAPGSRFELGQTIVLRAAPDERPGVTYAWEFDGVRASMGGPEVKIQLERTGTIVVRLTVSDPQGRFEPASDRINIEVVRPSQPPQSRIVEPARDLTLRVGQSYTFRGQGSAADADLPLRFRWDFGGAAPDSNELSPTVRFTKAGRFRVVLTVIDARGGETRSTPIVLTVLRAGQGANPSPSPTP